MVLSTVPINPEVFYYISFFLFQAWNCPSFQLFVSFCCLFKGWELDATRSLQLSLGLGIPSLWCTIALGRAGSTCGRLKMAPLQASGVVDCWIWWNIIPPQKHQAWSLKWKSHVCRSTLEYLWLTFGINAYMLPKRSSRNGTYFLLQKWCTDSWRSHASIWVMESWQSWTKKVVLLDPRRFSQMFMSHIVVAQTVPHVLHAHVHTAEALFSSCVFIPAFRLKGKTLVRRSLKTS